MEEWKEEESTVIIKFQKTKKELEEFRKWCEKNEIKI